MVLLQDVLQAGEGISLCSNKLACIPRITPAVAILVNVFHVTPHFLHLVPICIQEFVESSVANPTVGPKGDRNIEFLFHDSCDLAGGDNIPNGVNLSS